MLHEGAIAFFGYYHTLGFLYILITILCNFDYIAFKGRSGFPRIIPNRLTWSVMLLGAFGCLKDCFDEVR